MNSFVLSTTTAPMNPSQISVLLVTSRQPPAQLLHHLTNNTIVFNAAGREAAREFLAAGDPVQAVVTDDVLADGDWRGVLKDALRADPGMEVMIYTGPLPEMDLFREARALGARSLLVEPYDRYQIQCLVQNAQAKHEAKRTKKPSGSAKTIEFNIETPVLLVSARNEHEGLGCRLRSYGLDVQRASNRLQARGLLAGNAPFDFVITAEHLPDGNWRGIVEDVEQECAAASVFVVSDSRSSPADVLETISNGAVLIPMQDPKQVQWMVELALARHRWKERQAVLHCKRLEPAQNAQVS